MPSIRPHEIYLASFPFGDTAGMKLRPVLSLTGSLSNVPEVLVAYISSVMPSQLLTTDIVLDPKSAEHVSTKLKMLSVLRLHKLATIHERNVARHLGNLSPDTISEVESRLRTLLGL